MEYTYEKPKYELIVNGDYEAIIKDCNVKQTNSGLDYLSIEFVIRDDVEQACQNRRLFLSIFRDKDEPLCFNKKMLSMIMGAVGTEEGKTFNSDEEIVDWFKGKKVLIAIGQRTSSYSGQEENYIKSVKKTKNPDKVLVEEEDITTDDLPF